MNTRKKLNGIKLKALIWFLIVLFFLINPFRIYGQASYHEINGISIHVLLNGLEDRKAGEPILVFENGWGMDLGYWKPITERLSSKTPFIAYDRPAVGKSEDNNRYPNLKNRADDLKQLLTDLRAEPPYILIGHSIGGLYIRGYAGFYPNEIAGLVFIDPADFTETREQWRIPFRKVGVAEKRIDEMLYERLYQRKVNPGMPKGLREEEENLYNLRRTDFAELDRIPLPDVPILFFVGGKFSAPPDKQSKEFDHAAYFQNRVPQWIDNWNKIIRGSDAGGWLIYCANAGHMVHWDEPELVFDNIMSMIRIVKE